MNQDSDYPSFPRHSRHHSSSSTPSTTTPTQPAGARRKIGVAVDLSEESAFAVRWAIDYYIRPGDAVFILHVSPTSGHFGADWGRLRLRKSKPSQEDYDAFTLSKVEDLAKPLKEAEFPHKIHIVKDHDMRERLCLETERLNLNAVIMGSRGFGAEKRGSDGKLGSVSNFCVHHCVCPVVVVRYPNDRDGLAPPGNVRATREAIVTVKSHRNDDDDDDDEEEDEADIAATSVHHEHIKAKDSMSNQPLLFCPLALFKNDEDEYRSIQFGESPILSKAIYEKYSSSSHLYPLDWCNNEDDTNNNIVCKICKNPIEDTTFFSCKRCGYYHKACIEPITKHPYHPKHTLRFCYMSDKVCLCCSNSKDRDYNCSICNFTICQDCAREPPLLAIEHPKRHEHTLFYFHRNGSLICDVCALNDGRSLLYSCFQCHFVVHKECVYFPYIIKISRHEHRISFNSALTPHKWLCGVCHESIDTNYGRYSCVKGCNYGVHSKCATRNNVWDGKELEGKPEDTYEDIIKSFDEISDKIIQHFSHQNHHMKLDEGAFDENKRCQACTLPICDDIIYSCMECDFILHQECAHLPRKKQHATHPHPLSLQVDHQDGWFVCTTCRHKTNGFAYLCYKEDCSYKLDIRCAYIAEPLDHPCHPHPLFLSFADTCSICPMRKGEFLKCGECRFSMCFGCATLPKKLMYKHDEHFLIFSYQEDVSARFFFNPRKKKEGVQHLCEVCEQKADPKNGIYMCNDCNVTLHSKCLLGNDMYMMPSGEIKLGKRTVNIFLNNRHTRNICRRCSNRCQGKIVFKLSDRNSLFPLLLVDSHSPKRSSVFCSFYCVSSFNFDNYLDRHTTPYEATSDRVTDIYDDDDYNEYISYKTMDDMAMEGLHDTITNNNDYSGYTPYKSDDDGRLV